MNRKSYILLAFSVIILFISCEKVEEFSVVPKVKYKDFYLTSGIEGMSIATGNLVFSFVDGDGDIGNFNNPDENNDADSLNMFITGSYKNGSDFIPFYTNSLNLPYIEEGVYRKTVKGDINIEIDLTIQTPDTLMYSFYLIDRAGHKSNTETTPVLIISELLEQL
ncbi:MAG: hypothetical protein A2W99_08790 [Bacteroidetes bacterium GWF2_33_16]|nr:MAG: hypothetical protein A2X00_00365 [Bacteroidetes bacterium GWE2_32_14]OFY05596.1 MAG: hypothetical protein A2W99_08790 [Bacteroidetes bacterium GWF2_33_16]